jgi:glutamyl-tRNA synthetase
MTIVTRFPPSPTGFMHIGTARTALFNWLYAKRHKGKMAFRIEDTDRARHSEEAVEAIINGMNWLGLDWDGEVLSQYARRERHVEVAKQLVEMGKAYYCYCTPEELDEMRKQAVTEGHSQFYDRRWRNRSPSEAPEGIAPVIRIKAPIDDGDQVVFDHVLGEIRIPTSQLDDMIILRSDGVPTYMLAVVVDDHDMGVTHVIRGDDHLNNTFRQNMVYQAMGWTLPSYAHLPLILGPDGAKLSKRHGATSVEEYKAMGYLPEAMRNYLLRLCWAHGDDEIITTEQAIEWFGFEGIGQSPARFDFEKLNSVNAHYMKIADNKRLTALTKEILEAQGWKVSALEENRLLSRMDELKSRTKNLVQLAEEAAFLVKSIPYDFDEKAKAQLDESGKKVLQVLHDNLKTSENFTADEIEKLCRSISDYHCGGKLGKVMMPFRAALTGRSVSPSIPHAAEALGKEETLARLTYTIQLKAV